jgi:hypothetical protein
MVKPGEYHLNIYYCILCGQEAGEFEVCFFVCFQLEEKHSTTMANFGQFRNNPMYRILRSLELNRNFTSTD